MNGMFMGDTLSVQNYDNLLLGWSKLTLQANVTFDAGNSQNSALSASVKQLIISTFNWNITDGGMSSAPVSSSSSTTTTSSTTSTTSTTTYSSNSVTSSSSKSKNSPGFTVVTTLFSIFASFAVGLLYSKRKRR